ncbi:hypothetical protein EYC84_004361 [Monilinia fructicola]|uniref:Uncharacterized protein n=1 Tax=Monilinia fructicola TaxID=38448 RepID=A0A5M9K2W9_MONFR|nr:hypothetical protein EYC84_004361 [Monilinia fructicola]
MPPCSILMVLSCDESLDRTATHPLPIHLRPTTHTYLASNPQHLVRSQSSIDHPISHHIVLYIPYLRCCFSSTSSFWAFAEPLLSYFLISFLAQGEISTKHQYFFLFSAFCFPLRHTAYEIAK